MSPVAFASEDPAPSIFPRAQPRIARNPESREFAPVYQHPSHANQTARLHPRRRHIPRFRTLRESRQGTPVPDTALTRGNPRIRSRASAQAAKKGSHPAPFLTHSFGTSEPAYRSFANDANSASHLVFGLMVSGSAHPSATSWALSILVLASLSELVSVGASSHT